MIVSFAVFTTALFGSCTSKEGSGEDPESPTTSSYKVRVKVSTGEYTRAGDDGQSIPFISLFTTAKNVWE